MAVIPVASNDGLLGLGVFVAVVIVVVAGAHAKLCPVNDEPGQYSLCLFYQADCSGNRAPAGLCRAYDQTDILDR